PRRACCRRRRSRRRERRRSPPSRRGATSATGACGEDNRHRHRHRHRHRQQITDNTTHLGGRRPGRQLTATLAALYSAAEGGYRMAVNFTYAGTAGASVVQIAELRRLVDEVDLLLRTAAQQQSADLMKDWFGKNFEGSRAGGSK